MSAPKTRSSSPGYYGLSTHSHSSWLIRFSHRRRFKLAIELLEPRPTSKILDYGSGDGYLLELLAQQVPSQNLTAFEPMQLLIPQIGNRLEHLGIKIHTAFQDLPEAGFDRIACLEVLEHLQPQAVLNSLAILKQLLSPGGILVISVPIEIGPPALLKYLGTRIIRGTDRHYKLSEACLAAGYKKIPRDDSADFIPHKGFDYRELKNQLETIFKINREIFSPLPFLGASFNAQALWQLSKISE